MTTPTRRMLAPLKVVLVVVTLLTGTLCAEEVREFVYKTTPQAELKLYVHFPPGWAEGQRRAAIVFFFGGGFRRGSVRQFLPQAEYLARRGMVACRADYRVSSRHGVAADACVEDAKSAVRWIRSHARELGVDPDRIAAGGGSAGGHLAAAAATVPGFEARGEDHSVSSKPNLLVLFNPVLETGIARNRPELAKVWEKISPNRHLHRHVPPAIIFFGTRDRLLVTARQYMAKARQLGLTAWLYVAQDQRHGFFNRSPYREATLWLTDRFLQHHGYLKGQPQVSFPRDVRIHLADSTVDTDFLADQDTAGQDGE